jgi:hypothetical protein
LSGIVCEAAFDRPFPRDTKGSRRARGRNRDSRRFVPRSTHASRMSNSRSREIPWTDLRLLPCNPEGASARTPGYKRPRGHHRHGLLPPAILSQDQGLPTGAIPDPHAQEGHPSPETSKRSARSTSTSQNRQSQPVRRPGRPGGDLRRSEPPTARLPSSAGVVEGWVASSRLSGGLDRRPSTDQS